MVFFKVVFREKGIDVFWVDVFWVDVCWVDVFWVVGW